MERLIRIKALQEKGMTLAEVALALSPAAEWLELDEPVASLEYKLAGDVVARVRSGIAPWRHNKIRRVLAEAARKLRTETEEEKEE